MEKEIFDDMYKVETQHWWFVARRKIIESTIEKLNLKRNTQILDAGCGTGDNLSMLSKYGNLIAMERDSNAFKIAQSRNIGELYQGELPNNIHADIKQDKDLIVLLDVLEHIDDDGSSLKLLSNYVKKEGILLLTVPAYQFLWTVRDEQHHHKRRYTVSKLKKIMETNGWKVNYISYFNSFLFPLALIDRLKQKMFPVVDESDLKMPAKWINDLFEKIFRFESKLIGKVNLPFGLSIIAVAEKQ